MKGIHSAGVRAHAAQEWLQEAGSLDDLLGRLQAVGEEKDEEGRSEIDLTDLPTFGGPEPLSTSCVWSWDAGRVLVGTCCADMRIRAREETEQDEDAQDVLRMRIVDRAGEGSECDYTIGYDSAGRPIAVAEEPDGGFWIVLAEGEWVENRYDGKSWVVEDGEWRSFHRSAPWRPDGQERQPNDGSQNVYDGEIVEIG